MILVNMKKENIEWKFFCPEIQSDSTTQLSIFQVHLDRPEAKNERHWEGDAERLTKHVCCYYHWSWMITPIWL